MSKATNLVSMFRQMATSGNPFRLELVTCFRRLISCDESLKLSSNHSFYFKTVCYTSNNVTHACVCGYEHEYFDYISRSGDIDKEVFEKICRSLEDGKCPHVDNYEDNVIATTGVTALRIAVAVNNVTCFEQIISKAYNEMTEGFLFKLTYLHIAAIRRNEAIAEYPHKLKTKMILPYDKLFGNFPLVSRDSRYRTDFLVVPNATLWYLCMKENLVRTVQFLLPYQYTIGLQRVPDVVNRAIFEAIYLGKVEITEVLLRYTKHTFGRNTVLQPVTAYIAYLSTILSDHSEFISIISNYFQPPTVPPLRPELLSPNPSLFNLAANLGLDECKSMLADLNPDCINEMHQAFDVSPYFCLISKNVIMSDEIKADAVKRFSMCGLDINLRDKNGQTVLYHALCADNSCYKVTQALLECGADAESVDEHENSAVAALLTHSRHQYSMYTKLKSLLYHNVSLEKVPFALGFALDIDLKSYLSRSEFPWLHQTSRFEIITDSEHDPDNAHYITQLLLRAGSSPKTLVDADIELIRCHPDLYRLLDDVLYTVSEFRSLKVLSRTALRRHFVGRQIHKFVELMKLPASIRDFILIERFLR